MQSSVQLEFLGTGTSQGVPVLGCTCAVCTSNNVCDNRLRSSVLISTNNTKILIDTGPDFRYQMLRSNNVDIDAVLYTHEHIDHVAGMDDVRAINFLQKKNLPLYGSADVEESLKRIFHYAFAKHLYPGAPRVNFNLIENKPFQIAGTEVIPILVKHGKMPVFGFRFGDLTYITDAKQISNKELDKVRGSKILIINALRISEHHSHFNLEQALEVMKKINPEQGYFTHISHLLGKHSEVEKQLPSHIHLAYDGLILKT